MWWRQLDVPMLLASQIHRLLCIARPRTLGLSTMARLAMLEDTSTLVKKYQSSILFSLKDPDVSIRKRALDLMFLMCDQSNCLDVVKELLDFLEVFNRRFFICRFHDQYVLILVVVFMIVFMIIEIITDLTVAYDSVFFCNHPFTRISAIPDGRTRDERGNGA